MSLHEACYVGDVDEVARLLASGASPNAPAETSTRTWYSAAGPHPKPLNCVAIAWSLSARHLAITEMLIAHGAIVDASVFQDHNVESAGGRTDFTFLRILKAQAQST